MKSPKVYFADVGTLCYLTGLKDAQHAMAGPMGGAILETAVITEVVRALTRTEGIRPGFISGALRQAWRWIWLWTPEPNWQLYGIYRMGFMPSVR